VVDLITIQLKIKEKCQKSLRLESIVSGVISTLFIKKLSFSGLLALSLILAVARIDERA
jgi:hypothetical protein